MSSSSSSHHRSQRRPNRRVVITGLGLISPLGSSPDAVWSALSEGRSGISACDHPLKFAGQVSDFTGHIDDFGPVPKDRKKMIRKGLKVMCRETQMAVAAAQLALGHAGLGETVPDPERSGVVLGSDYMLTMPADYEVGIRKCSQPEGEFEFNRWGDEGLDEMSPLWMLKYLPNMPASHIAILNDLRGPNNSLTMREAASNLAVGEAFRTIGRGHADRMIAGATGTRFLPMQSLHAMQTEQMADASSEPAAACRPFDKNRTGMVAGEGAAMVLLEELETAQSRGATIYAEILGIGTSNVAAHSPQKGQLQGDCQQSLTNAISAALRHANYTAADVGHINAHGLGTADRDSEEARAIVAALGERGSSIPLTAPKSYFGNLGAGSGAVELISSVLALQHGRLPRVLNYETPDPDCPVSAVCTDDVPPGGSFLNLSVTPQGQASVLLVGVAGGCV